jgi:4-hydroxybenzoate polyprenyltransferase
MSLNGPEADAAAVGGLTLRAAWRAMRPRQWTKNLLVFAPLVFSGLLLSFEACWQSCLAFVAFSAAASGIYVLNDIFDRDEDRHHPAKRLRPVAAGDLSVTVAFSLVLVLTVAAMCVAAVLGLAAVLCVTGFVILNIAYSYRLKQVVIIDVMAIAGGFTLRCLGGAAAIGVEASTWLLSCTALLALLVGFGKRRHELAILAAEAPRHRASLAHYSPQFLDHMMGVSAAAAIVTYLLYTMDAQTVNRFGTRGLVATAPFVLYGVFRYLYLVHERQEHGDPANLLVTDLPTLVNGLLWCLVATLVIYWGVV